MKVPIMISTRTMNQMMSDLLTDIVEICSKRKLESIF